MNISDRVARCRVALPWLGAIGFVALAGLLGSATAGSTTPWVPKNVREELSVYQDIVQAQIDEEDERTGTSASDLDTCETT